MCLLGEPNRQNATVLFPLCDKGWPRAFAMHHAWQILPRYGFHVNKIILDGNMGDVMQDPLSTTGQYEFHISSS